MRPGHPAAGGEDVDMGAAGSRGPAGRRQNGVQLGPDAFRQLARVVGKAGIGGHDSSPRQLSESGPGLNGLGDASILRGLRKTPPAAVRRGGGRAWS